MTSGLDTAAGYERPLAACQGAGTVPTVADLLRFVHRLADDPAARDRFRSAPHAVLDAEVDDAATLTGEDVEAVAGALRRRLPPAAAQLVTVPGPVRPVGAEAPRDAAARLLTGLCDALD